MNITETRKYHNVATPVKLPDMCLGCKERIRLAKFEQIGMAPDELCDRLIELTAERDALLKEVAGAEPDFYDDKRLSGLLEDGE